MKMDPKVLTKELEKFSRQKGADLFGVADLEPASDFIATKSPAYLAQLPRAISLGMRLNDWIVDHNDPNQALEKSPYLYHAYQVVTPALNALAYDVARWLTRKNFQAYPVSSSGQFDTEKLEALFSHKLAAHLAGLGWIGKSCLLISEAFGPRVRWVTVLTDAPLQTGDPLKKNCGDCQICVQGCPPHAFTGKAFRRVDPREVRFDAFKCYEYRKTRGCGLCVSSCPAGRERLRSKKK
jgi:epoxyqueuosine reductase